MFGWIRRVGCRSREKGNKKAVIESSAWLSQRGIPDLSAED